MPTQKFFLVLGGVNALLAVILGAFGAHALKTRLPADMLAVYHTGVQYHCYHALGLILVGLAAAQMPPSAWLKWSGGLMIAGIVLFSGSLYLLSTTGLRALGAAAPLGGGAFILAWFAFIVAVLRAP